MSVNKKYKLRSGENEKTAITRKHTQQEPKRSTWIEEL